MPANRVSSSSALQIFQRRNQSNQRRKSLVMVALTASLSARSFPFTPACPGGKAHSCWGFTVKQGGTTTRKDCTDRRTVSTSSFTMEVEAVTHALRWIASRGDTNSKHWFTISFLQPLLYLVRPQVDDIFPSTTAVFSYATGLRYLSFNHCCI